MRVLVTGGSGFLGKSISDFFQEWTRNNNF